MNPLCSHSLCRYRTNMFASNSECTISVVPHKQRIKKALPSKCQTTKFKSDIEIKTLTSSDYNKETCCVTDQ